MIKKDIYQDIINDISDKTANKIISENLQHTRNFEVLKKLVIFMIPARKAELHDSANKTR